MAFERLVFRVSAHRSTRSRIHDMLTFRIAGRRYRCSVVVSSTHFSCPSCGHPLLPSPSFHHSLACANGHVFSKAREGHVHLLPPMRQKPHELLESEAIVRAQRAFFEMGGFARQASALAEEVSRALSRCPEREGYNTSILAAGCGEGIYLRKVGEHLAATGRAAAGLWGTDTEKLAVRYAAGRQPGANFAVASPHKLPFADGSFDVVLVAFAHAPWDSICRVLRPGSAVISARAGPDHLRQLSQRVRGVLKAERAGPDHHPAALAENYMRVRTEEVFAGKQATQLLEMTPFIRLGAFRDELRREVAAGAQLPCTVDLIISTHRVWLGTGGETVCERSPDRPRTPATGSTLQRNGTATRRSAPDALGSGSRGTETYSKCTVRDVGRARSG